MHKQRTHMKSFSETFPRAEASIGLASRVTVISMTTALTPVNMSVRQLLRNTSSIMNIFKDLHIYIYIHYVNSTRETNVLINTKISFSLIMCIFITVLN